MFVNFPQLFRMADSPPPLPRGTTLWFGNLEFVSTGRDHDMTLLSAMPPTGGGRPSARTTPARRPRHHGRQHRRRSRRQRHPAMAPADSPSLVIRDGRSLTPSSEEEEVYDRLRHQATDHDGRRPRLVAREGIGSSHRDAPAPFFRPESESSSRHDNLNPLPHTLSRWDQWKGHRLQHGTCSRMDCTDVTRPSHLA